jgi:hypothetical protein
MRGDLRRDRNGFPFGVRAFQAEVWHRTLLRDLLSLVAIAQLFFIFLASPAVSAVLDNIPPGSRVALVIGNGAYEQVQHLPNPRNDAEAIAKELRSMGFVVQTALDVDAQGFRSALQTFEPVADKADIALFFYAGHGLEMHGVNYLIPTDARISRASSVEDEAISLPRVISALDGAHKLRLVILDACRNNPFLAKMQDDGASRSVTRGLARVDPTGVTLVAFAADAGAVAMDGQGKHSPYTTALLKTLNEPGLELNFVFRKVAARVREETDNEQTPVTYGTLGEDEIYLVPKPVETAKVEDHGISKAWDDASRAGTESAIVAFLGEYHDTFYRSLALDRLDSLRTSDKQRDMSTASLDDVYWMTIRTSRNPEDFRAYLRRMPSGPNADLAEARIKALERAAQIKTELGTNSGTPEDLANAIQHRADTLPVNIIQYGLDALGYPPQQINGVLDRSTKQAIRAYQASIDQPQTGRLTSQQVIDLVVAAAATGETHAQTAVGVMLASGDIWDKDYVVARAWLERAADKNNPAAIVNLAIFYRDGLGIGRNLGQARRLLIKAKSLGASEADTMLAKLGSPT